MVTCPICEDGLQELQRGLCPRCGDAERSARRSLRERVLAALERGDRPEAVRAEKALLDELRGPVRARRPQ